MTDITFNGMTMEYSFVENMMDEELRDTLLQSMPDSDEQQLLDAYLKVHKEKFGSDFLS